MGGWVVYKWIIVNVVNWWCKLVDDRLKFVLCRCKNWEVGGKLSSCDVKDEKKFVDVERLKIFLDDDFFDLSIRG